MKLSILVIGIYVTTLFSLLAQGGLVAEYYNGENFDTYIGQNLVPNLDFYWDQNPPINFLDPHLCSVRYTGKMQTPRSGDITFSARVDDGIRVWINEILIINNWQLNDVGYAKGTMYLKENVDYNIRVEYFNALKEAELRLFWKLPEDPNKSWLRSWWDGDDPVVISPEFFDPPLKKLEPVELKPEPEPVAKPKVKPPIVKQEEKSELEPIVVNKDPVIQEQKHHTKAELKRYIPKSVEFEQAKADILAISHSELNTLAAFLAKNPNRKVKISGHTDYVGDASKNLELSNRRARSVAAYLIKNGVSHTQIVSAIGYGGSQPIVESDGRKYHPENRRVEFVIE